MTGASSLTPAPHIDAAFGGTPPTADEWRDMAVALACFIQDLEGPLSRGQLTRDDVLRQALGAVRDLRSEG